MAKKKKKPKGGHKEDQGSSTSPETVSEQGTSISTDVEVTGFIDRGLCSHIDKGLDTDTLSAKIRTSGSFRCDDCRGHTADSRAKKGKGKHGKKRGTTSKSVLKAIWVCLECGHFGCGGLGLPTAPQSHAVRHGIQYHHPLVVHYENHHLLWCFLCNKIVPEDIEHKKVLKEVSKMLTRMPGQGSNVDVEGIRPVSVSVTSAIKSSDFEIIVPGVKMVHSVRGLLNLGNTCFFNSVMQNLLAIDCLREYLFKLDESVGPLIASLRKFFLEISSEGGLKSAISPRSVFGSICTKAPQFRGYQQHDSHELLRCMLDGLSIEELSARKYNGSSQASIADPTFVDVIFGGQLSSTVTCLECGHSSTTYEPFLDLSLPVPVKRIPRRKVQPLPRGKKPKVPPKKSGRNHSKMNRQTNTMAQSTDDKSLGGLQTTPQPLEQMVLSLDSTDPNATGLDMVFTVEDILPVQKLKNKQADENVGKQSGSLDVFAWLDYLDPTSISEENDQATETDEISSIHDFSNEIYLQNDVSLSVTMHSKDESNIATAFSAISLDSAEQINEHGPGSSFTFEDKHNEKLQSSEGSFARKIVQNDADTGQSSELSSQDVFAKDTITLERDSENLSQIHDSPVILLPSKEMEVPSSVPGYEQESSDFVGFGNIFSEPEVPSGQPLSESNAKNVVNGNISESDPYEVDAADAPVSVESCLALFTKSELLLKDEHSWKCDNCSKGLRDQKNRLRSKLLLPKSEAVQNDCEDINASMNRNLDVFDPSVDIYEFGKCMQLQNHSETETNESLNLNNHDINTYQGECLSGKNGFVKNDYQSAKYESKLTDQEDRDLEKLKVKRDATKTILIRKVPSVLTIQLKRFSQDARGRLSKLNGHVNFRETIDLKPYMDPRCIGGETFRYRLVGLVEHLGSMRGGHYVAYVRGNSGKECGDCAWYHASDAHVRHASLEEVTHSQAYILFYERI